MEPYCLMVAYLNRNILLCYHVEGFIMFRGTEIVQHFKGTEILLLFRWTDFCVCWLDSWVNLSVFSNGGKSPSTCRFFCPCVPDEKRVSRDFVNCPQIYLAGELLHTTYCYIVFSECSIFCGDVQNEYSYFLKL